MSSREPEEGGEPACWAGLLCPECGAVMSDGHHREGCAAADQNPEGGLS